MDLKNFINYYSQKHYINNSYNKQYTNSHYKKVFNISIVKWQNSKTSPVSHLSLHEIKRPNLYPRKNSIKKTRKQDDSKMMIHRIKTLLKTIWKMRMVS